MNHERCVVCDHYGKIAIAHFHDTIYLGGKEIVIPLCYTHSVEFFKIGQTTFMLKHEGGLRRYDLNSNILYNPFGRSGSPFRTF